MISVVRRSTGARKRHRVRRGDRSRAARGEGGFTLVELLIVVTIVPLIIGALGAGLVAVFSLQGSVSNRLGDSADAQVVTSTFIKDVQSAVSITTSPTAAQCGAGTQLLGLQWGTGELVSYSEVLQSGSTYSLVRNYCATGASPTATKSTTVSYDVVAPCGSGTCESPPIVYSGGGVLATSTGYADVQGVTKVVFLVQEAKSAYNYTLSATPADGSSTAANALGGPTNGPTCGFALPGTGTYSSTLCFVGFTNALIQSAEGAGGSTCTGGATGVNVSAAVPGGYTMKFCLTVTLGNSNDVVIAKTFPTWPGAFLGNDINGTPFYTGVGCADTTPTVTNGQGTTSCIQPAIYEQTSGAIDTVTASNIVVLAPNGADATNYRVITADAETTDPGESLTWTSSLPAGSPFTFSQVPDTSSSAEGDACNETNLTGSAGQSVTNGAGLSGVGTARVTCVSTWQSGGAYPRTGTVLLEVSPTTSGGVTAPVTISARLQGAGLQGMALGLLLP